MARELADRCLARSQPLFDEVRIAEAAEYEKFEQCFSSLRSLADEVRAAETAGELDEQSYAKLVQRRDDAVKRARTQLERRRHADDREQLFNALVHDTKAFLAKLGPVRTTPPR